MGSYGLPATERTIRSARLPGVRLPSSSLEAERGRRAERREPQRVGRAEGIRPPLARPRGAARRPAARPTGRTTAPRPASRCRGPTRSPAARRARRAARCRSRAARSSVGSGRRARRASASRAISPSSSVTQCAQRSSGQSTSARVATARLPVGATSTSRAGCERAGAVLEPLVLAVALGEVRADGDPERQALAVDLDRAGVRRVGRDADPDEVGLRTAARGGSRTALRPPRGRCRRPRGRRSPAGRARSRRPRRRRRSCSRPSS